MNIAILGIGNILLSDDGIGVHVIRRLQHQYKFPESVRLIDGGTMGLDLLPFLEGIEKLLIIDAVDLKKEHGTIEIITGDKIPSILSSKLSVHQVGLTDLLFAIRMIGTELKEICLIGIQPKSLKTGTELTEEIRRGLKPLMENVLQRLKQWGIEVTSEYSGDY